MPSRRIERWGIPTPFPVGDVNAYYLPGKEPTLVDPGPLTPEAWSALSAKLQGKKIRRVLFTHYHVDHSGLAARVQRDFGAEVAAHAQDGAVISHWGEHRSQRQRDYADGLRRAGVPEAHLERMRYGGIRIDSYAENARLDTALEEGDTMRLGDRDFEVLHTPGHTAGSMLLRAADKKVTLSGDTLLERITPNALSVRKSERDALPNYLETLRRLQREPLGEVLPGHGNSFTDPADVIAAALRHAEVRQDRLVRLARERPGTAFGLATRLFLRLPDDQLFLAVSETLGHLEFLRRRGRIFTDTGGEADVFRAEA